ncbi:ABC-type transporter, integral membrane subunit [Pseudobacteroides cellulosolvens ATCC 35603 = DSM 2933]|uniref:Xylose transport system permease protein XylH n=1 Tax=Pseudobacteroides cellulosolvens ATCC 35603 = DSM 2933 TaxID=398512 RepID=A0A0L6JK31_9FIRM|nr:ABC-type transporter, integral membrane subunit [Pseudobacteroides cellulosolvens ATCC 35603 = DSM 2933]
MEKILEIFRNNIRQYAMLIALVVIMVLFQILTDGLLLLPQNVANLILQNSYVLILAIGMTFCIISSGNVDLSVGSLCALLGAISGTFIISMKMNTISAIILVILISVVIGIWQGFWIAYVRIPAFIVTLAGMLIFRGLTNTILEGGITLAPFPDDFQFISSGFIPDIFSNLVTGKNFTTLLTGIAISIIYILLEIRKRKSRKSYGFEVSPSALFIAQIVIVVSAINLFSYSLSSYKGIPVILVLIGALILIYSFIASKTIPGRHIYAMGGNEKAAKLSGVKTNKMLFLTYINMAVLSAVAGICFASRLNSASPQAGLNFELDAIAACFIGVRLHQAELELL